MREVSDNELIERKQQPTQSVGLITDIKTQRNEPEKSLTCGSGSSNKSNIEKRAHKHPTHMKYTTGRLRCRETRHINE